MLKLVKWAYNLGVKHERARIAQILRIEGISISDKRDYYRAEMKEETSEVRKDWLKKKEEVFNCINQIINKMFEPDYNEPLKREDYASPINPKGEE